MSKPLIEVATKTGRCSRRMRGTASCPRDQNGTEYSVPSFATSDRGQHSLTRDLVLGSGVSLSLSLSPRLPPPLSLSLSLSYFSIRDVESSGLGITPAFPDLETSSHEVPGKCLKVSGHGILDGNSIKFSKKGFELV